MGVSVSVGMCVGMCVWVLVGARLIGCEGKSAW